MGGHFWPFTDEERKNRARGYAEIEEDLSTTHASMARMDPQLASDTDVLQLVCFTGTLGVVSLSCSDWLESLL
jgi:hypothetical protein